MKPPSDEQLIADCLEGNERAWAALIDRYKQLIYSAPLRYRMSPEDAGDIFQSVCLELYNSLPRLREQGALRGWLATVAAHQCFHWKRRGRRIEAVNPDLDPEDGLSQPSEVIEQMQREQILRECVESLSPRCRQMVHMLFFEDPPLPYAEVAKRLGLATGSIGFIRGRCLEKLRRKLEEAGFC